MSSNVDILGDYPHKEIREIIRTCKIVLPYVLSIIAPNNYYPSKHRHPERVEMCGKKLISAYNELSKLQRLVNRVNE